MTSLIVSIIIACHIHRQILRVITKKATTRLVLSSQAFTFDEALLLLLELVSLVSLGGQHFDESIGQNIAFLT